MKEKGDNFEIKWDIVRHAIPYKCGTRKCDLCLTEKLLILQGNETNMINKRSEIISKCRHGNKFKLKNMKYLFICSNYLCLKEQYCRMNNPNSSQYN